MKKLKEAVRFVSKIVGGAATVVFLRASILTGTGWLLMAISALVGLLSFGAYKWAEPDVDISDLDLSSKQDKTKS